MTPSEVPASTIATAGRLLAERLGMRLNPTVAGRLTRSVLEEATASRLAPEAYGDRLRVDPALFQGLVDRVSVQETSFFRDPGQLEAFRVHVLPSLRPPVRIWSAGCSNGQEPYTLAMLLAEHGVRDWQVTATDVSSRALERTQRARYSAKEMAGVPAPLQARYFQPVGRASEVVTGLRNAVRVAHHNLVTDSPPFELGQCDVVFCRNVLIYLSHDAIATFLERLTRWLRPPGWLFLGYSESLWQITEAFQLVKLGSGFAYRMRPARGAPEPRPASAPLPRPAPMPDATVATPSTGADVLTAGHNAMRGLDFASAVVAFRKYAYLHPDQAVAHLHLGLALEADGDAAAARRAFAVARATLHQGGASADATLEGYSVAEVARLLDAKLAPE